MSVRDLMSRRDTNIKTTVLFSFRPENAYTHMYQNFIVESCNCNLKWNLDN